MRKPPTTYDEITRRTVPEPDSSFRPTPEQVRQAREGFRALDRDEQQLLDRVRAALAASGVEIDHLDIEVERERVTVRGQVRDQATLARVSELVREAAGDGEVVDHVVIREGA